MLDAVVEIVKRERETFASTPDLVAECRDVLERCLFDKDAALAVLRGEHEVDDQPWARCPECDCDTYFQFPVSLGYSGNTFMIGPLVMFVCEGCQHTVMRARANMHDGLWWEKGQRLRARPEDIGHPYRGDAVDVAEDDDEADAVVDVPARADDSQPLDWGERKVCPDGACIGIIREDGLCSVCGRSDQPISS
jgi:hypothetical protein